MIFDHRRAFSARCAGLGGEEALRGEELAIHVRGAGVHGGPQRGEATSAGLLAGVLPALPVGR